jgi:hypothetical protein
LGYTPNDSGDSKTVQAKGTVFLHVATAVWIFLALTLVVLGLFFLPIRVEVNLAQDNGDTDGQMKVSTLFGIVRWHRKLVGVKLEATDEGPSLQLQQAGMKGSETSILTTEEIFKLLRNWRTWVALLRDLRNVMRKLLRHVHVEHFSADVTVGTGGAASTGIACGALWAVLARAVGSFTRVAQFQVKPELNIRPDFDNPTFRLSAHCIARVRMGYAMITALRLFGVWRRRTSDGTPNPGSHENSHGEHSRDGRREYNYRRSG